MKTEIRAAAVAIALGVVSCATVTATYDANPAVDFDAYKTFSWVSAHPLVDPSPVNPLLERSLEQTARELLAAKGYRFVDSIDDADFVVGFGLGATDKLRIDTYPAAYRGGPWYWPGPQPESATREITEGRLVVDIFDVKSRAPAWHGTAAKTITNSDQRHPPQAIRAALATILANFPPV